MSTTLLDTIIHGSGATADYSKPVRIGGDLAMRIRASCGYGLEEPSTRPRLRLETSRDGGEWVLLVDLGEVGSEPVEATATLPADVQLRVAWDWTPDGDDMLHWAPLVVCQP
jgi:hypothetical protein